MKKIYYLQEHLVELGDIVDYKGLITLVTEELISLNPELFLVKDTIQELLDKAREDYPIGTMFNSKYGIQKVLGDNPFMGIPGTIQINTDRFTGGATIYTPEDGWAEILPLKFTTEDGVDIYGGMKTYLVHPNDSGDIRFWHCPWDGGSKNKGNKYFYHKENALAYIEKHKEKTLDDYENILFERGNSMICSSGVVYPSMYGWLKYNEPKLYYTKILQLIADDLNDGWKPNFIDSDEKWIIQEDIIDWTIWRNYGSIPFKTKELAEKARAILGYNVNYLFN